MSQKEITIGGAIVSVSQPYAAGHVMNEAEAKSLNQTRSENISNNCRKFVAELNDGSAKVPAFTDDALAAIAAHVSEYDAGYEFTLASAGGGRKPVDPLEKECIAIAKNYVTGKIRESGKMVKDYEKEQIAEMVAKVAANEGIIKAAKASLKQKASLADIELSGLADA